MSIFKKKSNIDDELNNNFADSSTVLPLDNSNDITPWSERNISAKHALTKEELLRKDTKKKVENVDSGSLFAKMAENIHSNDFFVSPSSDSDTEQLSTDNSKKSNSDSLNPEPEKQIGYKDIANTVIDKIPIYKSLNNDNVSEMIDADSTKSEVSSLLEKCKSFIYDDSTEESELVNRDEPLYELETVDEILTSIKEKISNENNQEPPKKVNYISTSVGKSSLESDEEDFYTKNIELQRKEDTIPENIKTVRHFADINNKASQDVSVPAREIPVKIKMFDRAVSEPIMIATKDNLDIGATRILPDIEKTEVSLKSNDIQMNLADSDIVKIPEKPVSSDVLPQHTLYKKSDSIKKELLDEFFENTEAPLPKPKYKNIISNSDLTLDNNKKSSPKPFSLLDATNEFNKIEENKVVEIAENSNTLTSNEEPVSKIENLKAIFQNLNNNLKLLKLKLIPTAILTAILLIITAFFKQSDTVNFVSVALFTIVCIINFDIIKNIVSVFSLEHGIDTPIAFACVLTFLHTVVFGFIIKSGFLNLTGIASLSVCANIFGKILTDTRIIKNIKLIDNTNEKNTLKIIENCDSANQIAKGFTDGDASIGTVKQAVNLKGFVANSFKTGTFENILSKISFVSVVLSVIFAVLSYLLLNSIDISFSVLVLTACVCYPPASLMILNIPLNTAGNILRKHNCAFAGFSGALDIERCNAVTVNATDIFPKGTIKLQKMYVLSENRVDVTFKYAAAVAQAANSPLAPMFSEIMEGETNLPSADDINYEDKMGISGWIKDKRILIGNRLLMEGHEITIPQSNIDKKILKAGYFPVYVAFDSRPCLLLICSYSADNEIGYNLRNICNLGITVLVNSCDPNTTEEMITDYFGLYDDSVKIITPAGFNALERETEFSEDTASPAVLGKSVNGFLKTFTVCNNLRNCASVMSVTHIFTIVVVALAICYFVITGRFSEINCLNTTVYLLLTSGLTCLSFLFKNINKS